METLQDKSTYSESSSSSGAGVSVCVPPLCYGTSSANISASKTDINSNYQSANEQSGIKTGDGGFRVSVRGNTDLKGGVMTSSDKAIAGDKNSLSTGTLTTSDLNNEASASATTSGYSLSTDMLSQGKYGAAKGVLTNIIDNASQSGSSSGQTKAAISAGTVRITDDVAQTLLTGNTGAQTIASLNRETQNANTVAQRQDVQAMKQTVDAERAIKNEAVKQLSAVTDEAYRVMFKEVPKFYKVTCPANTNCTTNPEKATVQLVDKDTQTELANAPSGAVLAVNGIDNPLERAGQLAMQNAELLRDANGVESKPTTIYLMHYVPANNGLSELMIAAYEKSLAPTLGYSNQDEAYAAAIQARGQLETTSLGHSRGTIVQTNANNMLGEQNFTNPDLSVRGVGGAVTGETYTDAALKVAGNPEKESKNITFTYFSNDPVPVVAGGNPGVISLSEFWRVLTTSNSAHSCYGTGAAGCSQVEILTPSAPKDANQNNGNLIRYEGGKRVDNSTLDR
jgi:filamentous hemagglutinin